ncbi:TolC family protein [Viscerimonas tarda]
MTKEKIQNSILRIRRILLKSWFLIIICPVSSYGQTDSLSHYLEVAARNNPGVKAGFLSYQASLQKVSQAGAYEDPQLEMGFFLKPMDIVDGRQVAEFKLMQMFPWFGTKKAAQTEVVHMAKMAFEQFRESCDNLYLEVYTQWFSLCSLQQKLANNRENKSYLTQLEELALRKFASPSAGSTSGYSPAPPTSPSGTSASTGGGMASMGNASLQQPAQSNSMTSMSSSGGMQGGMGSSSGGMQDVLRIQLEMAELDNNIESIQSEIKAAKARFNALLNRPSGSEVSIPDSFSPIPFLFDISSAMNKIAAQNPMLGMISEEGLAYKAKAEMDKKMSYPMFGIGLQYMLIQPPKSPKGGTSEMASMQNPMQASSMGGGMEGADMIMPMVSVSIPIYRNKYKAQQRESSYLQQANREKYINTRNALEAELYQTNYRLEDASGKIALYKKQSELAQTAYNLALQEFISGKSDLSNVIQIQRQLLDYRLKNAEAIANYNILVASLQKLISFKDTEQ